MNNTKPKILKADGKERSGRGFSRQEINKAGLNKAEAKKLEIPVDKRRKTVHDQNIETVKAHVEKKKAGTKPKPQSSTKKKAKK